MIVVVCCLSEVAVVTEISSSVSSRATMNLIALAQVVCLFANDVETKISPKFSFTLIIIPLLTALLVYNREKTPLGVISA